VGRTYTVEFAGLVGSKLHGCVTKYEPHKALKLIASGTLTFDEIVVHHRVARQVVSLGS